MPKGSKVHQLYSSLVREGYPQSSAAKIAQSKTGLALKTGRRFKKSRGK